MNDGIDHINIYSKGLTRLGRDLSNFSSHAVRTPYGEFASIEGYWYFLGCLDSRREELRGLSGWRAKQLGRELKLLGSIKRANFRLLVAAAMMDKLINHPEIYYALSESKLPFRHYYLYGDKVVEPKDCAWIVETWEFIRSKLV